MKDLGFAHLHSDAGIFMCQESTRLIVAVVYVDDAMFFSKNEKLVKKKKALFMAKWECQDLRDVKEFLRMRITCTRTGITIDQCNYLEKVLTRFQLTDAKPAITPLLNQRQIQEKQWQLRSLTTNPLLEAYCI